MQLLESDKRNLQTEITHLHMELRAADLEESKRTTEEISRLRELVTQQAAVEQFRAEAFAWFTSIAAACGAEPPKFPDHVPT